MVASHCWINAAYAVGVATFSKPFVQSSSAHIAQVVEHFLGKEEVTGSSPVMSSTDDDQDALGRSFLVAIANNQLPQITSMRRTTHG